MNATLYDSPELTRFALGEMPQEDAASIQVQVESDPHLHHEVEQIRDVASQLIIESPLQNLHLLSSQRRRVLTPPLTASPRSLRPIRKPQGKLLLSKPMLWAAAIVAVATATWLIVDPSSEKETSPIPQMVAAPFVPPQNAVSTANPPTDWIPTESHTLASAADFFRPTLNVADVESAPPEQAASQLPAQIDLTQVLPEMPSLATMASRLPVNRFGGISRIAASRIGVTQLTASSNYTSAARDGSDSLVLRPKSMLPPSPSTSKLVSAKPSSASPESRIKPPAISRKPELLIDGWQADVASCPWNDERRLLRIIIQLPTDQEAATRGDFQYDFQIKFAPVNVREYRHICTRHFPADEQDSEGRFVIWYEFLPNGPPAETHRAGKKIATLHLPSARFTASRLDPVESSELQVLDFGRPWQDADEDFVFDTAVVGLAMLLENAPHTGSLNLQTVLDLAEMSRGDDPDGERETFITNVRTLNKLLQP